MPGIDEKLGKQICHFMQSLRALKLEKSPGVTETIDWALALAALHIDHLEHRIVEQTLGVVIKDWRDTRQVQLSLTDLMQATGVHSKIDTV